jgi:tetratricopeptide (TPR) repeat protein
MAIKGSLREASLADVCQLLAMGQKTGCLSVTDQSRFGRIFFDKGRITHAGIINRRDRLGDLLLRDGVLNLTQIREALEEQAKDPDVRLGEILLNRSLITPEQFERYLRIQTEEAVYSLFTWSQGSFFFEVNQPPPEEELELSLSPESLLLEGARRVDEWSLIEKKVPSMDLLFEVDRPRIMAAGVELTAEQEVILPLLDGSRTVQDLMDQTGLGEFEAGKAIYGLVQAGFAHRVGQRITAEAGRAQQARIPEYRNLGVAFYRTGLLKEATREFGRVLELDPTDLFSRFYLLLIAVLEGRDRDALEGFKALVERDSSNYAAFVNLAFVLERLGRSEDALLVLERAESIRPGGEAVMLQESGIRLERKDFKAAISGLEAYRAGLAPDSVPSAAYFHQSALASALVGKLEEANSTVEEGLAAHPTSAPLMILAGVIAERRSDFDGAERFYRRAAEEDPALAHAHKNLGDLAYRRGNYDAALEHYLRAIELAPELGDDVYTRLGNLYYRQMDRDRALECWEVALRLNPQNRVVRNNLEVSAHESTQ